MNLQEEHQPRVYWAARCQKGQWPCCSCQLVGYMYMTDALFIDDRARVTSSLKPSNGNRGGGGCYKQTSHMGASKVDNLIVSRGYPFNTLFQVALERSNFEYTCALLEEPLHWNYHVKALQLKWLVRRPSFCRTALSQQSLCEPCASVSIFGATGVFDSNMKPSKYEIKYLWANNRRRRCRTQQIWNAHQPVITIWFGSKDFMPF